MVDSGYMPMTLKKRTRLGRLWYTVKNHREFRRLFGGWRGFPRQLWWALRGVR